MPHSDPLAGAQATSQRPHIVFVLTDQQRFDTIAALGHPFMHTPALDRLASQGMVFNQCHVAGASCAPARASLFSGYYPHSNGILRNADLWRHSWVESLAQAGYTCVNIGNMHTWPMDTACGFHQRHVVENKDRFLEARYFFDEWDRALAARGLVKQQRSSYRQLPDYRTSLGAFEWQLPEDAHSDVFVGDRACWWIENHPKAEPVFLQIGFPGPHPPYDPVASVLSDYMGKDLPIADVKQADLDGQPAPFHALRQHNVDVDHDSVVHMLDPSAEQRYRQRAHYLSNVTMIDRALDKVLAALKRKGYLDNTIVVFTSDHGDCLGDHGHSQKWTMYEQITRVPMIVWAPGRVLAGGRTDALVQQMDVAAWLLEQAGAQAPEGMEARSLTNAFADPSWAGRDAVYCEQGGDGILTETRFMTMVRTRDWKLVHFIEGGHGQLFNLREDPREEHNLWHDSASAPVRREMLDRLLGWRLQSQLETRNRFSAFR